MHIVLKWWSVGMALCLLLGLFNLLACDSKPSSPDPSAKEAPTLTDRHLKADKVLRSLAQSHNADTSWEQVLKERQVWTEDLQKALIRQDSKLIAGTGLLQDVELKKNGRLLHLMLPFDVETIVNSGITIEFRLEWDLSSNLDRPDADQALLQKAGLPSPSHAFVARIRTIQRYDDLIAERSEDEGGAHIKVGSSPHYVAYGEGIALKYIGSD